MVFLVLLLALLWPDNTDTGEERETEVIETDNRLLEEEDGILESNPDTLLKIAPEPRDKTEEVVDTIPEKIG